MQFGAIHVIASDDIQTHPFRLKRLCQAEYIWPVETARKQSNFNLRLHRGFRPSARAPNFVACGILISQRGGHAHELSPVFAVARRLAGARNVMTTISDPW